MPETPGSPAIVGPNQLGLSVFSSGITVFTVRDGTLGPGVFVPLDAVP
jgi:hypothetical protein